jgi:hypothetical protein
MCHDMFRPDLDIVSRLDHLPGGETDSVLLNDLFDHRLSRLGSSFSDSS